MKFYTHFAIEIHNTLLNICQFKDAVPFPSDQGIKVSRAPSPYDLSFYVPFLLQHSLTSQMRNAICLDLKKKLPIETVLLTDKGFLNFTFLPSFWISHYEEYYKNLSSLAFLNDSALKEDDFFLHYSFGILQKKQMVQKYMEQTFQDPLVFLLFSEYALYLTKDAELAMIKRIIFYMESLRKNERAHLMQEIRVAYEAWWHSLKEKDNLLRLIDPANKAKSQARFLLLEGITGILVDFYKSQNEGEDI